MSVKVVTDSACDLSDALVEAMRIEVVPLTIRFGDEELVDREELSPEEFWDRLRSSTVLPETSAPSAGGVQRNTSRIGSAAPQSGWYTHCRSMSSLVPGKV